jgi:hypothetical protein
MMNGGGIYGKMCSLSNSEEQTRKQMSHAYSEESNPYSIDKHKGFQQALSKYKTNERDIREHKDYSSMLQKIRSECKTSHIKDHPQYAELMKKYAVSDTSTCPPTFKACPKPGTYLLKPDIAKNYVSRKDEGIAQLAQYKKKYVDLAANIKIHPQYTALMSKYASIDNSTCPPTFRSCKNAVSLEKKKQKKKQKKLIKIIKNNSESGEEHASVATDRNGSENTAILKEFIKKHPELKDIKKHPQYKALMNKVSCLDNTVCPPTYKKCKNKCPVVPITQHPDIHKYILKSQLPKILDKECRKMFNK